MLSHLQKVKYTWEIKKKQKKQKQSTDQKIKLHNVFFPLDMLFPHQQRIIKIS